MLIKAVAMPFSPVRLGVIKTATTTTTEHQGVARIRRKRKPDAVGRSGDQRSQYENSWKGPDQK